MNGASDPTALIESFLEMLAAERGAAKNTLDAYRRDLSALEHFLDRRGTILTRAEHTDITAYLRQASEAGLAPASRARALSSMRQLFSLPHERRVGGRRPDTRPRRPKEHARSEDALGGRGRAPDGVGTAAHRGLRDASACGR